MPTDENRILYLIDIIITIEIDKSAILTRTKSDDIHEHHPARPRPFHFFLNFTARNLLVIIIINNYI